MKFTRQNIVKYLWSQIHVHGHIIGVAVGSGMTTKFCAMGGADIIFALSAGKFRQMGRSSHACYLCYTNSNDLVKEYAVRELLTMIHDKPIIFGYNATDPTKNMAGFLKWVKDSGFAGMNNYPSVGVIDGQFREALEEDGITYQQEVDAVRMAHEMDLFTVAFVFNEKQAGLMLEAGADIICVHLGLTKGGLVGAKKTRTLANAKRLVEPIFRMCAERRPEVLRMVYGGPVETPIDMQYIFDNTMCHGYIGGSSFERVPVERAIYNTALAFKNEGDFNESNKQYKILSGNMRGYDYVAYVREYIREHYMEPIYLNELALTAHVSQSYLSVLFKKETGVSFREYLIRFRLGRVCELLKNPTVTVKKASEMVGYTDYTQFSKTFKKYEGITPGAYQRKVNRETKKDRREDT